MKRLAYAFVVFVCILQAAMPANAADFTLEIFGNANMDDTIDEDDIEYVEGIIDGTNDATELADANYDGEIDEDDIAQIELIIAGEESELTLVDSADRIVTVTKPVERVIALNSYPIEAMRMFGDMDKVIGVSEFMKEYDAFLPEVSEIPSVGDYPYNPEAILAFEPDLVTGMVGRCAPLVDKLPDNIAIVGLNFYTPDTFLEELTTLSYIFDGENSVDEYLSTFHDRYIDLIKSRTEGLSEEEKPKVYAASGFGDYCACGNGSGLNTHIELAGGRNIFADLDLLGGTEVNPEEVMIRNPDIIIRSVSSGKGFDVGYNFDDPSDMIAKRDEIMGFPELTKVNAVKNGRVYIMSSDFSNGLDYPIAIVYQAKCFHPELFEDLDPLAIHQEYIDRFCPGLDFDVYKHGVFVYHPDEHPDGR